MFFCCVLTLRFRLNFYLGILFLLQKIKGILSMLRFFIVLIACFLFFRLFSVSQLISDGHSSTISFSRSCFSFFLNSFHFLMLLHAFLQPHPLTCLRFLSLKTLFFLLMHFHLHFCLLSF